MDRAHPSPLPPQRDAFELPADVVYLNSASKAPYSRAVSAAGTAALQRQKSPWQLTSADWFTPAEALRALSGELMGAGPEDMALIPAVSYGVAIAAATVPFAKGQEVVLLAGQFPSNVYRWHELAERNGGRVRTVVRDPQGAWTEPVLDAITADTAVVAVPNFHWTDGAYVDLGRVAKGARRVGAALFVDASQSFGVHPIDVSVLQPDFVASVGYKWQLGPYGLGYLYVAPKWQSAPTALESSWVTRAGSEDFAKLTHYEPDLRPGARRFDMGEFSHFVLLPMATAALTQIRDWGPARIGHALGRLTKQLADGVAGLDCATLPEEHRARHLMAVRPVRGAADEVYRRLNEEGIYVSLRDGGLRVSPHVYNDEEDVARLITALKQALQRA